MAKTHFAFQSLNNISEQIHTIKYMKTTSLSFLELDGLHRVSQFILFLRDVDVSLPWQSQINMGLGLSYEVSFALVIAMVTEIYIGRWKRWKASWAQPWLYIYWHGWHVFWRNSLKHGRKDLGLARTQLFIHFPISSPLLIKLERKRSLEKKELALLRKSR